MLSPEVQRAMVKYGVLGPIVIWALWTIDKQQDRMFGDMLGEVRKISAAVAAMNAKACADICREASK